MAARAVIQNFRTLFQLHDVKQPSSGSKRPVELEFSEITALQPEPPNGLAFFYTDLTIPGLKYSIPIKGADCAPLANELYAAQLSKTWVSV